MFKKAKENKKGFTLAELLIVVAIIAVLVAISIPIFTSQLEKSRDAVTVSNLRAAYAEAQASYLTNSTSTSAQTEGDVTYTPTNTGATVVVKNVVAKGTVDGFNGLDTELTQFDHNGCTTMGNSKNGKDGKFDVTFTYTVAADGSVTIVAAAAASK